MPETQDHYDALQLPFGASLEQIEAQYKRLTRLYHPDRNPDDADWCNERLQAVTDAYNTLADPARKAAYDASYRPSYAKPVELPPSAAVRPSSPSKAPPYSEPGPSGPSQPPPSHPLGAATEKRTGIFPLPASLGGIIIGVVTAAILSSTGNFGPFYRLSNTYGYADSAFINFCLPVIGVGSTMILGIAGFLGFAAGITMFLPVYLPLSLLPVLWLRTLPQFNPEKARLGAALIAPLLCSQLIDYVLHIAFMPSIGNTPKSEQALIPIVAAATLHTVINYVPLYILSFLLLKCFGYNKGFELGFEGAGMFSALSRNKPQVIDCGLQAVSVTFRRKLVSRTYQSGASGFVSNGYATLSPSYHTYFNAGFDIVVHNVVSGDATCQVNYMISTRGELKARSSFTASSLPAGMYKSTEIDTHLDYSSAGNSSFRIESVTVYHGGRQRNVPLDLDLPVARDAWSFRRLQALGWALILLGAIIFPSSGATIISEKTGYSMVSILDACALFCSAGIIFVIRGKRSLKERCTILT